MIKAKILHVMYEYLLLASSFLRPYMVQFQRHWNLNMALGPGVDHKIEQIFSGQNVGHSATTLNIPV